MANVIVDKTKIDLLANAIADKSGEALTMTLDEMVEAVDGIEVGGGITPTGNINITQAGVTDVTDYATATVAELDNLLVDVGYQYESIRGVWSIVLEPFATANASGFADSGSYYYGNDIVFNAIPTGTSVTPTESSQTIGGANTMMEGAVTVNAIPSNYVGSGITQRSSSDLTASGATVTAPSGYYSSNATKTIASGTEGTPTATKSAVSNHALTVTPSVTNSAGYISGGTHNGTAVTVSASELVSGSQSITDNGDYDVTNLASVTVNVSGGGGGTVAVGTKTTTLSASASSISFTGLSGNPTSFVITSSADQSTGGTKAVALAWDGTSFHGMDVTTQAEADTGFTKSYSSGTLTITATTASFQANEYKLVYSYGGSSSDIHTADVQVGSGATSITFTSLSGNPIYWSCIFKSDFGTSSGYQRVIDVVNDGTSTYGHAFDSSAKAQTSWSATYSGGSLTITSSGTNNGGYFHQPGYYQLTYAVDDSAPTYQTKSAYATTSAQTITADNGYDALEQVNLGALSQTNLTADNIKSGTTVTINNGNANVWSVTGTYSGGGGSSDVVIGTLNVASNVNTSTSTQITTTSAIGFTPTKFFFYKDTRTATSNHVHQATFTTMGSYYIRTMTRYSSNALSTSGNTNSWTTQTAGYLYFNNNTIYFRSSSSYILSSGTWYWVAVK